MPVRKIYTKEIFDGLGYRANWLPGRPLHLGDVGHFVDGVFERTTSLAALEISFAVRRDPSPKNFAYRSDGRIELEAKLSGSVGASEGLSQQEAGLIISCKKKAGVMLEAVECHIESIESLDAMAAAVMALHSAGSWPNNQVLIREIVRAGRTTVVAIEASGGCLALRASAAQTSLSPTSADAEFATAYEKSVALKIVAEKSLTPLYRVAGISRKSVRRKLGPERLIEGDEGELEFEYALGQLNEEL